MTKKMTPARLSALFLAPALFGLAACEVPAEDPDGDPVTEDFGSTDVPDGEPVDIGPLENEMTDDGMPADSGLEGGAASEDAMTPDAAMPPAAGEAGSDDMPAPGDAVPAEEGTAPESGSETEE